MNSMGEVVGHSLVNLSYKNEIYKQVHATKWINGRAIDLHNTVPKSTSNTTCAIAINDLGDVLIRSNQLQIIRADGRIVGGNILNNTGEIKTTNSKHIYNDAAVADLLGNYVYYTYYTTNKILNDYDSIWLKCCKIIGVNDNGEILAEGITIYGEQHVMFLTPKQVKCK